MMLSALIMDLRKTFTFDATHHIVRWKGRTVLKAELGEIPFDHITTSARKLRAPGRETSQSIASRSSPREPQSPWVATAR
jgi:hypothetical protein